MSEPISGFWSRYDPCACGHSAGPHLGPAYAKERGLPVCDLCAATEKDCTGYRSGNVTDAEQAETARLYAAAWEPTRPAKARLLPGSEPS